jgi:hypothetical protein
MPNLDDQDRVTYAGNGTDRGRSIRWELIENAARAEAKLTIEVNSSGVKYPALFPLSSLSKPSILEEDWIVAPAVAATGGSKQSWMCINTKSDQFDRIGRVADKAIKMPRLFDVRVPMGNANYGLIHLLAGHTNNMRKFMGTTNQAQSPQDEGYRTMQGIQMGLLERLGLRELKEIRHAIVGSKWMFSGKNGALLVTKKMPDGTFWVTTLYEKNGASKDKLIWKRKVG